MNENTYVIITTTFDGGLLDSYTVKSLESKSNLVREIGTVANGLFHCRENVNQIVVSQMDAKTEVPTDLNFKLMLKCGQNLGLDLVLVESNSQLSREGRLSAPITITGKIVTPYSEGSDTMLCRVSLNAENENGPIITNLNEAIEVKVGETELQDLTKYVHQTLSSISVKFAEELVKAINEPERDWAMGQVDVIPSKPDNIVVNIDGLSGFMKEPVPCCGHDHGDDLVVNEVSVPELHESEVLTTVEHRTLSTTFEGYDKVNPSVPVEKVRENPDLLMSIVIFDKPNDPRIRYVKFSGATSELANSGFIAALDREITRVNSAGDYGTFGLALSGDDQGLMQLQQSGSGSNYANIIHRTVEYLGLSTKVDVDFCDNLPEEGSYVSRIQDVF